MKYVIAAALSLLATIAPVLAQSAEVAEMFDPSDARDSADGMASAFMSAAIRLGRERHMSYGRLNTAAMTALQRQRAMAGSSCRLEALVRNYGKFCDALIESHRADMESTETARPHRGS